MTDRINKNLSILLGAWVLFIAVVVCATKLTPSDEPTIHSVVYETIEVVDYEEGNSAGDLIYEDITDISDQIVSEIFNDSELLPTVEEYAFEYIGYSTARLNIRTSPNVESSIWDQYHYNDEIHYSFFNPEWSVVDWNGNLGYVNMNYVSDEPMSYVSKSVSNDRRKSYEDYRILSSSYKQGRLQKYGKTSPSGFRKVDDRYCIALGSYYSHVIGQYVDVVLENGLVLHCIVADAKADKDTSADNSLGNDGGCVEFIVDTPALPDSVKFSGDCSRCRSDWNSPVVEIRLYNYVANA